MEKCKFAKPKVHFIGHVISQDELGMDEAKMRVMQEWLAPTMVTTLRSFLGLAIYYRRFISGYSSKAALITELLKNNKPWVRIKKCQREIAGFETAVTEEPARILNNLRNS